MNSETESSAFKRFAAGSIVMGIVPFSFAAFSGLSVKTAMPFSLVSMLWFFLGGLAYQTRRFADRMEARIAALETKMSESRLQISLLLRPLRVESLPQSYDPCDSWLVDLEL